MSQCFEQYLYIYIEAQDRNMADLIDRHVVSNNQFYNQLCIIIIYIIILYFGSNSVFPDSSSGQLKINTNQYPNTWTNVDL